jgi:hypothetical protein
MTALAHAVLENTNGNLEKSVRGRKRRRHRSTRANAGLELGHMEYRMHPARRRKVQTISHCSNPFHDEEGTEELECQFMVCSHCNRRLEVRLETQEHFVADGELPLPSVFVSLVFHALLHPEQMLFDRGHHQLAFTKPILDISRSNAISSYDTKIPGMAAIEELERCVTRRGMPIGIVPKLAERDPLRPLLRVGTNEATEVTLD